MKYALNTENVELLVVRPSGFGEHVARQVRDPHKFGVEIILNRAIERRHISGLVLVYGNDTFHTISELTKDVKDDDLFSWDKVSVSFTSTRDPLTLAGLMSCLASDGLPKAKSRRRKAAA